jgi:hypothetical protein
MVYTDVGVRCGSCAPPESKPLLSRMPFQGSLGGLLAILLVVALIGTGGALLTGASNDDPYEYADDYADGYLDEYSGSVTVHEVVDPWIPENSEDAAPSGRRYIAVEVTVENDTGADFGVYSGSGQFQLKDKENFVEDAVVYEGPQAEPELPEVTLDDGEKARGWVTFEVNDDSEIVSMTSWTQDVPLPSQ